MARVVPANRTNAEHLRIEEMRRQGGCRGAHRENEPEPIGAISSRSNYLGGNFFVTFVSASVWPLPSCAFTVHW